MGRKLNISHYVLKTRVLGPFVRSALWVSGCCFNCKGCLAKEMNARAPSEADADGLAEIFAQADDTEGITISGGEPFLQADALCEMIGRIRGVRDYGVIAYTGFTIEELEGRNDAGTKRLLDSVDILIDGRYEAGLDDGKPYRGSSNQRILCLTERYADSYDEYYLKHGSRNMEIVIGRDFTYMVGVPSKAGLKVWEDLKNRGRRDV